MALLAAALSVSAAEQSAAEQGVQFQGRVSSFDESERTLRVGDQTYQLLPTSRVTRSDKPASVSSLAEGQTVEGRYKMSAEGKREVLTLDITRDADRSVASGQDGAGQGVKFQGQIGKIDREANTVTIDGTTYHVLPTSRLTGRAGRTAQLSDLSRNQQVTGTYKQSAEGRREILTLDVGREQGRAVGGGQDRADVESGATFQGQVGRINRENNTVTIGGNTYHILPTTRILNRNGRPITLSDLNREQRVHGTYRESAEGRREVLTLEVGRPDNDQRN